MGYSINLDYIIYTIYYVDPLFHILGCKLHAHKLRKLGEKLQLKN